MGSSSSPSGSAPAGATGTPGAPGAPGATTTGGTASPTPSNAAIKLGGTTGLLSLAGLVAGILL